MKNYKKLQLSTLVLLGLLTFSCQNQDDLNTEEQVVTEKEEKKEIDESKLIDFKGLPVNHRFSTPVEELEVEHDYETLKSMYNTQRRISTNGVKFGLANPTVQDLPAAEEIVAEAETHVAEYPFGDDKTDEEKWEMIKNDFPTLTEEQIAENMDLIDQYYSQNLDYETIAGLANTEITQTKTPRVNQQAKIGSANATNNQIHKMWCIIRKFQNPWHIISPVVTGGKIRTGEFSYIRSLISIYYASTRAERYSTYEFPNLSSSDTKRDAFRHVFWSSLLARYYWTVSSKSKRLKFAEAVGNANETCGGNEIDGMNMDFHNNRIGRELFNQNTSYKRKKVWFVRITYGLNLPSTSRLRDLTTSKVNGARFISESSYPTESDRVNQIRRTNSNQVVYLK